VRSSMRRLPLGAALPFRALLGPRVIRRPDPGKRCPKVPNCALAVIRPMDTVTPCPMRLQSRIGPQVIPKPQRVNRDWRLLHRPSRADRSRATLRKSPHRGLGLAFPGQLTHGPQPPHIGGKDTGTVLRTGTRLLPAACPIKYRATPLRPSIPGQAHVLNQDRKSAA
jgi:hypothetical protein